MNRDDNINEINITSNNQMGGITAHTVNYGPHARQMDDSIGAKFKIDIPVNAKITITAIWGNSEAFNFAHQIMQWLKSNGYKNVNGVDQAAYSAPVSGIHIQPNSENKFEIIVGSIQ